jgi:hypothetical protein
MPYFSIFSINFNADNPEWIYGDFYNAIKKYVKTRKKDFKKIEGINETFIEWITKNRADDILEILKSSKEINWHKL